MNKDLSKINCEYIEKILFQSSIHKLDAYNKKKIEKHISNCDRCKTSEKLYKYLGASFKIELENSKIKPDPAILKSLKNKLIQSRKNDNFIFQAIKNLFEFRIPVYQVVTTIIIILVFLYFFNNKGHKFDSFNNDISIIAEIDSNKIIMNYQNSIELIDNSGRGKSIMEDSVLSSFIQSAM